jgi:glycosyltransferase involved in cell wall biosynthesis
MISILVPVFNHDVAALVQELGSQLSALGQPSEIIVADDHSADEYRQRNRSLQGIPYVQYTELPRNLGRLRIRLHLASLARYEWLLFLDSDSRVISPSFIKNYLQYLDNTSGVITGGRVYEKDPPADCRFMLHWKYGSTRENIFKQKTGFLTNNFCIRKGLLNQLSFDAPWQGYGHEDTWIGIQLEQLRAQVKIIQNPILHDGLEPTDIFLQKSLAAVENLPVLASACSADAVAKHVRLYRMYLKIKRSGLTKPMLSISQTFSSRIQKNLHSCNPSLQLFDIYRLSHLLRRG